MMLSSVLIRYTKEALTGMQEANIKGHFMTAGTHGPA